MTELRAHALSQKMQLEKLVALATAANIIAVLYYLLFFGLNDYLPSPYLHDKSDTFMDFFNPLFWASRSGVYSEWQSIYPPLNFLLLQTLEFCFANAGIVFDETRRERNEALVWCLLAAYFVLPWMLVRLGYWRSIDAKYRCLIYIYMVTCTPLLFTLERGNLIIIAPLLIGLLLNTNGWGRNVWLAILINLKPYLVVFTAFYVLKRPALEWLKVVCISGAMFFLTGEVLGSDYMNFFENLLGFSDSKTIFSPYEILTFPSSISAFGIGYASLPDIGLPLFIDSTTVHWLIESVKWAGLIALGISVLSSQKHFNDEELFFFFAVAICNLGYRLGGYIIIIYLPFLPVVLRFPRKRVAYAMLALFAPFDVFSLYERDIGMQNIYLSGVDGYTYWTLGLGALVRPIVNYGLLWIVVTEAWARQRDKVCQTSS